MTTTLTEERIAIRIEENKQAYQVRVFCTASDELPDTGIFLYQIVDQNDPLQDVFVRICSIADFSSTEGYLNNRLAAIIAGGVYWRSSAFEKVYEDIDVAVAAVQAISDRVNTLVNDYETYSDSFGTSGTTILFPSADPTQVDSLKTAYNTGYEDYQSAVSASTTAQTNLDLSDADLSNAEEEYNRWIDLRTKFREEFGNDLQAMSDAYVALNNFVSQGVGNATQIVGQIDSLLMSYQGKFGIETRKISFQLAGYVNCLSSDIGKTAKQTVTLHSGVLMAFNNSSREWWVVPNSTNDTFTDTDSIYTEYGIGFGYPIMSMLVGSGPVDAEIAALQASRNIFDSSKQQALNAVTAASNGVSHHTGTATFIGDTISALLADVTLARTNVTTTQVNYNKAQGNIKTAYDNLEIAYNEVKAVCPNWSPPNPFPPVP